MARSSMYDYDDSDEEEEDDEEEDLDYMGIDRRLQQQLEYQDDPGYSCLLDICFSFSRPTIWILKKSFKSNS